MHRIGPDPQAPGRGYRAAVYLAVAGLAMILYRYLTPPLAPPGLLQALPWIGGWPGDLPGYAWRFLMALILLGGLPLAATAAFGERVSALGLRRPRGGVHPALYALLAALSLAGGLVGSRDELLAAVYPFSRTLVAEALAGRPLLFVLHGLLYVCCYYLPWELLFRGFLVFPLLRLLRDGGDAAEPGTGLEPAARAGGLLPWLPANAAAVTLVSMQAILSALLHVPHPLSETLVALPFGVILGVLALRTGSVLPGLALHVLAGLSLDLFIVLRLSGVPA